MSQVGFFQKLKQVLTGQKLAPLPVSDAEALYYHILKCSRAPSLYRDYGVEDSIDGRFDSLCLFQSLMMCRLKSANEELTLLGQGLFDAMFQDMDLTLREMGVGDMGVGKRVKFMSEAYMGRLSAYDKALQETDDMALVEALHRNLYRDGEVSGDAAGLAVRVREIEKRLALLPDEGFAHAALTPSVLAIQDDG